MRNICLWRHLWVLKWTMSCFWTFVLSWRSYCFTTICLFSLMAIWLPACSKFFSERSQIFLLFYMMIGDRFNNHQKLAQLDFSEDFLLVSLLSKKGKNGHATFWSSQVNFLCTGYKNCYYFLRYYATFNFWNVFE